MLIAARIVANGLPIKLRPFVGGHSPVGGPAGLRSTAGLAIMVLLGKLHRSGRFIAGGAGRLMVAAGAHLRRLR